MPARQTAIPMALALLLPTVLLAAAPTAEAATDRVLTITTASAHPVHAFRTFDGNPLKTFDFDGDGRKEIIAQNDNRYIYVFDSKTGALRAELTTTYPANWGARSFNGPESAVLVQNGVAHLIVANSAAYITDFVYAGKSSSGKFIFNKMWERRLNDCYGSAAMDAKPVILDLDKNGRMEILAQTEEVGVFALRDNGQVFWKKCIGGGNGEPGYGDLNLDGWVDVVFASDGGVVTAVNGRTGATMWAFGVRSIANVGPGSMSVGPTVAQLDGLTGPDVVVGVRDAHDCTNFNNNHAGLLALSSGGRLLWFRQPSTAPPLSYTHPIVHDVDGNGKKDVLWATWNTQGHKCGNWEVVRQGQVYRFDNAGTLRWTTTTAAYWSNKDIALADVDQDGVQEVLAVGTGSGGEGVWYLNSITGAKETFVGASPYKVSRGPVVDDLWGTGTMQWVLEAADCCGNGVILVYDTHARWNAAWPHLPDSSFTAGGGSEPPPPPPPPPENSTFTATFEVSPNINNWWVEVWVSSTHTITAVDARVNGGSWTALGKTNWGSWAKSFRVESGSDVQFRAKDSAGAFAQSQTFDWP